MKKKILVYGVMLLVFSIVSVNAVNISDEEFMEANNECLENISIVKKSVKKFPEGTIIKVSEDDTYILDNPSYTGNYYFVKGNVGNLGRNLLSKIEYKGETYYYLESQLPAALVRNYNTCKELLPFYFPVGNYYDVNYYEITFIPKNAILEYDAKNKTLKVLPQDDKLVKELLEIIKQKKNNKK